jgi:hypothetical protein
MSSYSVHSKRLRTKASTSCGKNFVPRLEVLESRDLLSTFTVTNTSSDVNTSGSLPWAVQQSNATPGHNTIDFNIPGSGVQVINLNAIQYISNPVTIDGTSQPGYNGTPLISVQGNSSVSTLFFVTSGSAGSIIEGLDMYNFTANAITLIAGSNGDLIQNNWMGFYINPSGQVQLNSALGYQFTSDIGIQTSGNTVRNNVMSGVYNAVSIGEDPAKPWSGIVYSGNSITANFIGTDPSGTTAQGYGNQSDAIFLGSGCQGNFLGPNNVMSGALHGIEINAPSVTGNVIFQNKIGTDVSGNHAIPNTDGIDLTNGAHGNTIGGPFGGNIISGNSSVGINLGVPGDGVSNNNFVQGNIIGLNGSQTAEIGAGNYGVSINSGSTGNNVQGNVIAGASLAGVLLQQASANNVSNNWIGESSGGTGFPNGKLGISVVQGSDNNTILGNFFGSFSQGTIFVDLSSIGNNISGANTSSNPLTQIIQEIVSFEENLLNDVLPALEQLLQNVVRIEQQIMQEVLHALSTI